MCSYETKQGYNITLKPSITDWVENVLWRAIFFNSSRWYRVTVLPIFLFVHFSATGKT
jgi:hypothetical protein